MRSLIQFQSNGERGVAALNDVGEAFRLHITANILDLAEDALAQDTSLSALADARCGDALDLASVDLLPPIDHADPAHLLVSAAGLTHLGSADGRDKMHKAAAAGAATIGLVGFGKIARGQHVPAIAALPGIDLIATAGRTNHAAVLPAYPNIEAMIAGESAMHRASPPRAHG